MIVFALLALIPIVAGHGYVEEIIIGSTKYPGYLPFSDPYTTPVPQRIVRQIPGNGPVEDLSLIDIQCNGYTAEGYATAPAPLYAKVAAGSEVGLKWTTWPDSHAGPIITYMAKVPASQSVTSWSPGTAAVWFKVAESGKTADRKWAATDLLTAANSIATFKIPASLQPGQYIIRHEIIALHGAFNFPGAQVYPSCIQVEVTGSGTKLPTSFVSFPGAYNASTPGILFDMYSDTSIPYPIPGPAVWTG